MEMDMKHQVNIEEVIKRWFDGKIKQDQITPEFKAHKSQLDEVKATISSSEKIICEHMLQKGMTSFEYGGRRSCWTSDLVSGACFRKTPKTCCET